MEGVSFRGLVALVALASLASTANAQVDPLTATVDERAAQRFAQVWRASEGTPTAAEIQAGYLDDGGRAIEVFTRGRIQNAEWLAKKVSENPALYRDAIERCLPWVATTNAELRATYLGFKGLFPDRPLPEIAVVIGADNSGGTAAQGIQVIGLEVVCRLSPNREAFAERMRQFFAHETVHTFQPGYAPAALDAPLVAAALREGVPDYLTSLITARVPHPERNAWASAREEWIWGEFKKDAETVRRGIDANGQLDEEAQAAYSRWFGNAGSAPAGWPDELGYWVGMRIADTYLRAMPDPRLALAKLIDLENPAIILKESGYSPGAPL